MSNEERVNDFIKRIEERMEKEMPRILGEIKVYEERLAKGELTKFPKVAPQYYGLDYPFKNHNL